MIVIYLYYCGCMYGCMVVQKYDHIAPLMHVLGEEDNDTISSFQYIWNKYLEQFEP